MTRPHGPIMLCAALFFVLAVAAPAAAQDEPIRPAAYVGGVHFTSYLDEGGGSGFGATHVFHFNEDLLPWGAYLSYEVLENCWQDTVETFCSFMAMVGPTYRITEDVDAPFQIDVQGGLVPSYFSSSSDLVDSEFNLNTIFVSGGATYYKAERNAIGFALRGELGLLVGEGNSSLYVRLGVGLAAGPGGIQRR